VPFTNSNNALALLNEQPTYAVEWFPYLMNTAQSTVAPLGSVMSVTTAGVGTNPGPGGDCGTSAAYTVPLVDLSSTTASLNPYCVGVLIGTGSFGTVTPVAPSTVSSPAFMAMCATRGMVQVLCTNTTTIGHTVNISTGTSGAASDSGGTTWTVGSTIGTAMQAVTISSGTALVWVKLSSALF
jgi:hypothetical protein